MGSRNFTRPVQVDKNQPRLIKYLRRVGAYVKPVHAIKNFCDIIIVFRSVVYFAEIKDLEAAEVPKYFNGLLFDEREQWLIKNRLTPGEGDALQEIQARGGNYIVIWDEDSIDRALGLKKPFTNVKTKS